MLPDQAFDILMFLSMAPIAIGLLLVSIRGIATRKPIVFPARAVVWVLGLAVLFMAIDLILLQLASYGGAFAFTGLLQVVLFALVIVVFRRAMQGYVVLSVTEGTFKQALLASLDELGMTYKETLAGLELEELGDVLHVSMQGWVGTAQFKMKGRNNQVQLQKIVAVLRGQLAAAPGRASLFIPIVYGVLGLLVLAFQVYIALEP